MSDPTVLVELRRATARVHAVIETASDIEARLQNPGSRAEMVAAFYAFHHAAESRLRPFESDLFACGWPMTSRVTAIARDLSLLGVRNPLIASSPAVATFGQALGWTYVVEGSTLGGRIIRRRLAAAGAALAGLDFLDPWGDGTGARWRELVQTLETARSSGRADMSAIVTGALAAFDFAGRVLVAPSNVEPAP